MTPRKGGKEARSLRERLREGRGLKIEPVDFPGFDRVWVRELTGSDRDRIAQITRNSGADTFETDGWRGRVLAVHLCNEQGEHELDPIEDGPWLNELPGGLIDAIIAKSNEINALDAKAVEAAKENFPDVPSDDSISESSETLAA